MKPKAPGALCDQCPFKDRPFAKTTGPEDAKVAVVSRSPGYYEALNGRSFAGPSGKVLDHLLKLHGSSLKEVKATNVVLCQSDGQEAGFGIAQACCEPRLEREIANVDTVIAAGSEALRGLLGGDVSIARNRGYVHHRNDEQRIIVTNNPAVVLRDDSSFPELVRDFRLAISPLPQAKLPTVKWTEDVDEARSWVTELQANFTPGKLVAVDIEGGYPNLACLGFSIRPERAVVFGIQVVREILEELATLLNIEGVRYLYQFGKYDVGEFKKFGIRARVDEDTGLLSYALDERPGDPESGAGGHSLEWLLKDELGWPRYEPTSVRDFKARRGAWANWPRVLAPKGERIELYEYNGMDTAGTLALFHVLQERAINDNVYERPYRSQLLAVNKALIEVESYGTLYDAEAACDILEEEVWPKLDEWREALRVICKRPEFNPNSNPQMQDLYYDTWGLEHDLQRPRIERKGKRSTDQKVREQITMGLARFTNVKENEVRNIVAFTELVNKWKELDTQRGTFLVGLILKRNKDGRVYTHFKIHGTESGRLSSSEPNIQNITRPKEGLPNIRRVFIPDPGCVFVSADLSQAELRTIAVLSQDSELQAIYLDTDRSLHKEIAEEFYGKNYTYEEYVKAKNINFGVAYWQSAFSFAQLYHMDQSEAQKFIDFWWKRFPQVWEWTKAVEREVLENGELQSPFGHKRRFYVIPQDQSGRQHVVKEGINFRPQNIAANITLYALCQFVEKCDPDIAQLRINVHDNLVINVRQKYWEETAYLVKSEMESAAKKAIDWDFPYKADISVGPTWGDLKEVNIG